jgi:peptide/nickel transport system ATP-binding protein
MRRTTSARRRASRCTPAWRSSSARFPSTSSATGCATFSTPAPLAEPPARDSATPLLEVDGLTVRFHTDDGVVQAVDGLSFTLAEREVLGIVGESGCGKSVSLMSLLRLLPSTAEVAGRARFETVDLLTASPRRIRRIRGREIAFVFQEPMTSLNPSFRVGRQIAEVVQHHLGLSRRAADRRAVELLDLVRIPAPDRRAREYPHQLSGGMRQRVMIAIALACDPKVLVADEPTTALDVTIQAGVLDLMRDIRERLGTAIVLITHNLGVVADLADRVLVMYAGRKVEEAPVDDLFNRPQHPYTVGLLAAIPRAGAADRQGRLREIPGRVPVLDGPWQACAFADRCPRADERTRSEVPPLREVERGHLAACFHPGPG